MVKVTACWFVDLKSAVIHFQSRLLNDYNVYYVNLRAHPEMAQFPASLLEQHRQTGSMLNRLPRDTPELPILLAEIGSPALKDVAKTFGVSTSTVSRWIKHGAPRPVLFSLWWLSRWGMHALNVEHYNWAQHAHFRAAVMERQVQELEAELVRLHKLADFGCANDPGKRA